MPRLRSRSPLSPILATESATVRLFFILSVLLCSVNKAGLKTETWLLYCLRLRSRSPHNAKHSTSYLNSYIIWESVSEPPLVDSTDALSRYIYIYIYIYIYTSVRPYVHRYCACAALRANIAGQIGNRVSPAESAFSACIGSGSSQTRVQIILDYKLGGGARFSGICKVARGAH